MLSDVTIRVAGPHSRGLLGRNHFFALTLAFLLLIAHLQCVRAENHVDYRYEDYQEDDARMRVQTHAVAFGAKLTSHIEVDGEFVHDSVSGATPYGALPTPNPSDWLQKISPDTRNAGSLSAAVAWGRNTTTPQFAYSLENDYESFGYSLNHAIDFNDKNTTLTIGLAHTHDIIFAKTLNGNEPRKDGGDLLIGITQLLGPKTFITANVTLGTAHGYLDDPYKKVHIPYYPDPLNPLSTAVTFREKRPDKRDKQIGYLSLTHFVTPLNGSVESSYRFYHDSYGIISHTLTLSWYQKIGKHLIISPMFRFVDQSEADFYLTQLPGDYTLNDPSDPFYAPLPELYSSDYRLAALQTFTYGLSATIKIKERFAIDLSYKRYEMQGKDSVTSGALFPKANVFAIGGRIWF
jgi:hypothetical protein